MIERGIDRTVYVNGIGGNLDVVAKLTPGAPTIKRLQLSNLHGDIVGEAPLSTTATEPSATWETDEFGVPREPVRAPKITQVGEPTAAFGSGTSESVTLATPAGTQPGDLLLAGVGALTSGPPITPTGWTPVGSASSWLDSGESRYKAYWRVAGENEPASHTFPFHGTKKHRVGMVALRNADTSDPIVASGNWNAIGSNATTNPLSLTVDDAAIVTFVGGDRGDADTGGSWTFPSPTTELWDIATGTTATDYNHAAGINVLINGEDLTHPTITIANTTGLPNDHWGTITLAIAPRHPTRQYRYRYLGTHERALELPSGVISMGARAYLPQLGRFLQTDPVDGGSANAYDYANQDPVNSNDLDGLCPVCVVVAGVALRVVVAGAPKSVRVASNAKIVRAVETSPALRARLGSRIQGGGSNGSWNQGKRRFGISRKPANKGGGLTLSYRYKDKHWDLLPDYADHVGRLPRFKKFR